MRVRDSEYVRSLPGFDEQRPRATEGATGVWDFAAFICNTEGQQLFEHLKEALVASTTIALPHLSRPLHAYTPNTQRPLGVRSMLTHLRP